MSFDFSSTGKCKFSDQYLIYYFHQFHLYIGQTTTENCWVQLFIYLKKSCVPQLQPYSILLLFFQVGGTINTVDKTVNLIPNKINKFYQSQNLSFHFLSVSFLQQLDQYLVIFNNFSTIQYIVLIEPALQHYVPFNSCPL